MTSFGRWRGPVIAAVSVLALAGCSPGSGPQRSGPTTAPPTSGPSVGSTTAPDPSTPVPSSTVPGPFRLATVDVSPRPPGPPLPSGERDGSCPYLRAGLNIEPETSGRNFADLEGNRVQRVTQLRTLRPLGCRFYFQNDFHPTGDILPSTYATVDDAYRAMIATARTGTDVGGVPSFVPGVDGIRFRTRLYSANAGQDWAFVFARGRVMVVVRTDQTDTSTDAVLIAKAIVDRF